MIRHYFNTVFRISGRYSNISIINILGLSIGLAVCILIYIYVKFETSFDTYHNDNDRIFRIEEESNQHFNGARRARCTKFIGIGIGEMEESEVVGCITNWRPSTVKYEDILYKEERLFQITPGILNILSFKVLEGDPATQISRPNTVILTETSRRRYFSDGEALGKLIKIDTALFEVVGVIRDIPLNSHFHADIMISETTSEMQEEMPEELILYGFSLYTYVKLKPNVDPGKFDEKIRDIANLLAPDVLNKNGEKIRCFLDPVKNIHLNNDILDNIETPGNKKFLYLISIIGILALLTNCLNFMNLSTARFISRTKEIGVRKTFGAGKFQLTVQFLGESLLIVFTAFIIAMTLVETGLIFINKVVQVKLIIPYLDPGFAVFLVSIITFTGLLAGSYPAFMLSSVNPVIVMKSAMIPGKSSYILRKVLILCQFTVSFFLIMSTFIITRQLNYMKNSPLGFIREQKLVFQLPEGGVDQRNYEKVKQTFSENLMVTGTSISSSVPGRWMYGWQLWPTGEKTTNTQIINCMQADPDFINLYGLEIIAGLAYDSKLSRTENRGIIVNESFIKAFGWSSVEDALTRTLINNDRTIRGVIRDYHFRGKNEKIGPFALFLINEDYRYITLTFRENNVKEVLKESREKYKELFPNAAEDFFFLDEDFNKQYLKEQTTSNLVLTFTVFSIFIACLGLYGMTAYRVESKRHTYGIIKVNGGLPMQIYFGILKEFLLWIGLAFVMVSPIVYITGNKWLMQFPYHIRLSSGVFIISVLILVVITIVTISLETYKIFLLNPADTIRNE